MINKLDLVAIKKNEKVYVKEKSQFDHRFSMNYIKLRFNAEEIESFHKDWKVFSSVPTVVDEFRPGRESIIKYKLKDGFTVTNKTPKFMTKDSFKCYDEECDNPDIYGLYEPVHRQEPSEWCTVDMNIELIDSDCEPLLNPKYQYWVKFPGYIDKHMIVQHKAPCFIKSKTAFEYIVNAVKKNIPDHCYISSDYDFHFAVEVRVPNLHKTPLINVTKNLIDISFKYHHGVPIQDVNADNYYELEKKMDCIIQGYIDRMKPQIAVCPSCDGCGWIEQT